MYCSEYVTKQVGGTGYGFAGLVYQACWTLFQIHRNIIYHMYELCGTLLATWNEALSLQAIDRRSACSIVFGFTCTWSIIWPRKMKLQLDLADTHLDQNLRRAFKNKCIIKETTVWDFCISVLGGIFSAKPGLTKFIMDISQILPLILDVQVDSAWTGFGKPHSFQLLFCHHYVPRKSE